MSDTVNTPQFWEDIYRSNDTRWDMGTATPVFIQLDDRFKFRPGTMLVPGCGRGYDAIYFASQGFEVTAVDFAGTAIDDTNANAHSAGVQLTALQEDVFNCGTLFPAKFDYVLEYTCFCAIDVTRRKKYIQSMTDALAPGGLFIGLFFPMDNRAGGPPFAVTEEEINELFAGAFEVILSERPENSVTPRSGKERLMLFKKL